MCAVHYPAALFFNEFTYTLQTFGAEQRMLAIEYDALFISISSTDLFTPLPRLLYDMLLRQTLDQRLTAPASRCVSAALFFPLVPLLLEYHPLQYEADKHLRALWSDRPEVCWYLTSQPPP